MTDPALRDQQIAELSEITAQIEEYRRFNQLEFYQPYPKQQLFHSLGAVYRERMLMAGNQVGKTMAAAAEVAMHLTGRYPGWWDGLRFDEPVYWWAAGVTGESTRDNPQRLLMGRKREYGTGMIPADLIIGKPTLARGVPDLLDSVEVRHEPTGLTSILWFKSYEKGREKVQGETLHGVWPDEEPPLDIYTEFLTRTNAIRGPIMMTFTPLQGMSSVVSRFLNVNGRPTDFRKLSDEEKQALREMQELDANAAVDDNKKMNLKGRTYVMMELADAKHYSAEDIAELEESYPEHEREARTKGIPMLGSGRVYPITEEKIKFSMTDFPSGFPAHFRHIAAVDFADWDHPTAGVWIAYDMDSQVAYLYDTYRESKETLAVHAKAFVDRGPIPTAWPHDGHKHDGRSGKPISTLWSKAGVKMLRDHAQHEDGSNSVQAGIDLIFDKMVASQFKVADHLADWWEEFRMYHRKDGKIVKERDDLMDATRYAMVSLKFARRKTNHHMNPQTTLTTLNDFDVLAS